MSFDVRKGENMQTTLLIMAAWIGSRFGGGIKQLETVDANGHIIMDYSIHDAIEAGFNRIVFIIRKDIEKEFKEVINADDYYGKEGFRVVHDYLVNGGKSCMAGFVLKNTLSDNGGVTLGICEMDADNNLTEVAETKNIVKTAKGAEADGQILSTESLVSMNMWGLTPDFLNTLEDGFKDFFEKEVPADPQKAEYLIPTFIGELIDAGQMSVKVLQTDDTWYGMTYKEDVAAVKESLREMLEKGIYREDLFADL